MSNIHRDRPLRPRDKQPRTQHTYRAPWYDTNRWRAERRNYIGNNPECEQCIRDGRRGIPATILDHIINIASLPDEQREPMFWDSNNWQALCTRCHNKKSAKERRYK